MSIELLILSNHLIVCLPLLLLPSIFSRIKVFPKELAHHNFNTPSAYLFLYLPPSCRCWLPHGRNHACFICVSSLSNIVIKHIGPTTLYYKFYVSPIMFSHVSAVFLWVLAQCLVYKAFNTCVCGTIAWLGTTLEDWLNPGCTSQRNFGFRVQMNPN